MDPVTPSCFLQWGVLSCHTRRVKLFPPQWDKGKDHQHAWPFCLMMHTKQKCIENSFFPLLTIEVTPTRHWTHFLCSFLCFAVHLSPFPYRSMSFKLHDGYLLNEMTLCVLDSNYWMSNFLRLSWHKEACVHNFEPPFLVCFLTIRSPHFFSITKNLKQFLSTGMQFYFFLFIIFFQ